MDEVGDIALRRGEHVLAAVSGGADSVALLYVLADAAGAGNIALDAAHFEHGIRGADSLADADFVRRLCASLGVPFHEGHADVVALARLRGIGLEEAAREARYAFLRDVKTSVGADVIALGHHMDDQAETVLMHLLRGAGMRGVCGMREREGDLFRPFLHVRKEALVRYLMRRGASWHEDATNFVADTPRNQIRLRAIPELRRAYPAMTEAVCRFSRIAALEDDCLNEVAMRLMPSRVRTLPIGQAVRLDGETHPALLARILKLLRPALDAETIEALLGLCSQSKGMMNLPHGAHAERTGVHLYLLDGVPSFADCVVPLPETGRAEMAGIGTLEVSPGEARPIRDDPCRQTLRAEALHGAVIRFRRTGDRIHPLGAPGTQKLSDYLINRRVERPLRDMIPLVAVGDDILWAVGLGISEHARLTGNDNERAYHLTMRWSGEQQQMMEES